MDPGVALLRWILVRGDEAGSLFPELVSIRGEKVRVDCSRPFSRKAFTALLHSRLRAIGIAETLIATFTSHCMKRGCVQVLRKLGLSDAEIMKRVFMTGIKAYLNYSEIFNNFHSQGVPQYGNANAALFDSALREEVGRQDAALAMEAGGCLKKDFIRLGLFLQSCESDDTDGTLDLFQNMLEK